MTDEQLEFHAAALVGAVGERGMSTSDAVDLLVRTGLTRDDAARAIGLAIFKGWLCFGGDKLMPVACK